MKSLLLVVLLSLGVNATVLSDAQSIKMLNSNSLEVIAAQKQGGITQLKVRVDKGSKYKFLTVFLVDNGQKVIIGNGYTAEGKTLEMDFDESKFQKTIDIQKYKTEAAFTYGTGKDDYYVFIDPDCPYCVKFEQTASTLGKYAKFHYFLMPLSFHKNSRSVCEWVLSKDITERKSYLDAYQSKKDTSFSTYKASDKVTKQMDRQLEISRMLSIRATPSVYNSKGQSVQWNKLPSKYLKSKPIVSSTKSTPANATASIVLKVEILEYLKKEIPAVSLGKGKQIYAFVDLNDKNFRKLYHSNEFKMMLNERTVTIFPFVDEGDTLKEIDLAYLLSQKKKKDRLEIFNSFMDGKSMDKNEAVEFKKHMISGSDELKPLVQIAFVMSKLNLPFASSFYDSDGKLLKRD